MELHHRTPLRIVYFIYARVLTLPSGAIELTLSYCSAYDGEAGTANNDGYDWAWVAVNGVQVEDVSADGTQVDWETRVVNLTVFRGQTVTLTWNFDSVDSVGNDTLGWQVDSIKVVASFLVGDNDGNGVIDECEGLCTTCPGDMNGDSVIDGDDVQGFVDCVVAAASCSCTDLDGDGVPAHADLTDDLPALVDKLLQDEDPACP